MTGLGATVYAGFFGIAALWLFVTGGDENQAQAPDASNAASSSAESDGSIPTLASHSSQ